MARSLAHIQLPSSHSLETVLLTVGGASSINSSQENAHRHPPGQPGGSNSSTEAPFPSVFNFVSRYTEGAVSILGDAHPNVPSSGLSLSPSHGCGLLSPLDCMTATQLHLVFFHNKQNEPLVSGQ